MEKIEEKNNIYIKMSLNSFNQATNNAINRKQMNYFK